MAILDNLFGYFSHDIGIDLGTANTLVYMQGRGIIINEPSVVAVNQKTGQIVAIGEEARRMVGRTPGHIVAIRPLVEGVISDFEVTEEMLSYFIRRAHSDTSKILARPRVVIGIPSGITEVERRAVHDAAKNAGAREVHLLEEPMAAAIGSSIKYATVAPADIVASSTARLSTCVTPDGMQTITSGLKNLEGPHALSMKYESIASVIV